MDHDPGELRVTDDPQEDVFDGAVCLAAHHATAASE